jgi:hypothetical protein
MQIERLTLDAIKLFTRDEEILLGWYSPSLQYTHYDYSVEIGGVARGINCPGDGIPVFIRVSGAIGNHALSRDYQRELMACLQGQIAFVLLPSRSFQPYSIFEQTSSTFDVEDVGYREGSNGFDNPINRYTRSQNTYYGNWWLASTLPVAQGDTRSAAYFWLSKFDQLRDAAIALGVQIRRNTHSASNAEDFSIVMSAVGGGVGVFMKVFSELAKDQDWEWFQTVRQVWSVYNLASGGFSASSAAESSNSAADTASSTSELSAASTYNEGLHMDELDFSAASTDYALAFPDFGENPALNVGFNDSLQGSIVNNGDTFSGSTVDAPSDPWTATTSMDAVQDTPFIPFTDDATGNAGAYFNDGGSSSYMSTPTSPEYINGISPNLLLNAGKQILTMNQSGGNPSNSPIGNNQSSNQIPSNQGKPAQLDRSLTQTLNAWLRGAGTAATVTGQIARGAAKVSQTYSKTNANIAAVNQPSSQQLGLLQTMRNTPPMQMGVLAALGVVGYLVFSRGK